MKRQLFTLLFGTFISALAITACKKNADSPASAGDGVTKEKLVGTYRIVEIKQVTPEGTTDILSSFNSCDRDNLFVLKADNTSAVVDAGERCSPSSDDTGTWEYRDSKTILLNGEEFTINSMQGNTLKMTSTYTEDNKQVTLNVTYVKQ